MIESLKTIIVKSFGNYKKSLHRLPKHNLLSIVDFDHDHRFNNLFKMYELWIGIWVIFAIFLLHYKICNKIVLWYCVCTTKNCTQLCLAILSHVICIVCVDCQFELSMVYVQYAMVLNWSNWHSGVGDGRGVPWTALAGRR